MSHADAALVGRGTLVAVAPDQGILVHHNADATLSGYVALNTPFEAMTSLHGDDLGALRDLIARRFADWAPALRSLVLGNVGDPRLRPIYALPMTHRWERRPGVTLVGDAAHLMSPFAGEGANLAMFDGAALAAAVIAYPSDVEEAMVVYEDALFVRSAEVARRSADNLRQFFGPEAPRSVVDLFTHLLT